MIGAVHNRKESVAFRARFNKSTKKAINNGLRDLSQGRTDVSSEEIEKFTALYSSIKTYLAATEKRGTFMLKPDGIQFEATNCYEKVSLPWAIRDKMIISGDDVVKLPPEQLHRFAEFLKGFSKKVLEL